MMCRKNVEMLSSCITCFFIISMSLAETQSLEISSANFRHQRVALDGGTANFFCIADKSLDGCQFKMYYDFRRRELPIYDTKSKSGLGKQTQGHTVREHQTNLQEGQCGMSVTGLQLGLYLIACRVRTSHSDWVYRYSSIYVSPYPDKDSSLQMEPTDRIIATIGSTIDVKCAINNEDGCNFIGRPGITDVKSHKGKGSSSCTAKVVVSEDGNGPNVWCWERILEGRFVNARGTSVVAFVAVSEASQVTLSKSEYNLEDILEATCEVKESRVSTAAASSTTTSS